jgi:hypothetical protein
MLLQLGMPKRFAMSLAQTTLNTGRFGTDLFMTDSERVSKWMLFCSFLTVGAQG